MWMLTPPAIMWLTIVLQIVSLVTLVLMRTASTGRLQTCCQRLFFAMLFALGMLTVLAVGVGESAWVASGTSLSAATIAATLDFGGDRRRVTPF